MVALALALALTLELREFKVVDDEGSEYSYFVENKVLRGEDSIFAESGSMKLFPFIFMCLFPIP